MFQMIEGKPLPLGVTKTPEGVQFAIAMPGVEECWLNLYRKKGNVNKKAMAFCMTMQDKQKIGDVFCCTLTGDDIAKKLTEEYEYTYEVEGKEVLDPYAMEICGRSQWGKALNEDKKKRVRCGFMLEKYYWGKDVNPSLSYSEMILYQIHVRGYTRHASSRVKNKGTFLGMVEKLAYLKEIGINGILLLPCYEFNEIMEWKTPLPKYAKQEKDAVPCITKLNYWGYTEDCFYFAPKASYASDSKRPSLEFKDMVKSFHKNGIEVFMEFKFPNGANSGFILDCLRNWVLEYHVDGFLVNQEAVPEYLIRTDPVLANTKLLAKSWSNEMVDYKERGVVKRTVPQKRLAEYNDGFMLNARKYVKSDEGMVHAFTTHMRNNAKEIGVVNYITNINGFTLMDLVSYDVKHNEANGEGGRDGTELNYSWNCGIEGKSRKRSVMQKRLKQMKNIMMMLMLSQGTPMILGGDEFGNSQNGNNNAYCQDNEIGWVNWNKTTIGKEFFTFVKDLIAFRKQNPIFHMDQELTGMDTLSCGFPDISFHSTRAWYTDFSNYSRVLGVMLCGKYVTHTKKSSQTAKPYYYIIFNMHWEEHDFDLPRLPDNLIWEVKMSSGRMDEVKEGKTIKVDQRTIILLESRKKYTEQR